MCRKYLQRCQKIFEGYSLISDGAEAGGLIVLLAVDVRAVAELLVAPQHGPPPLLVLEQYSTLHYSTVHYITVQYSTVQYSTVQYSTWKCQLKQVKGLCCWHLCCRNRGHCSTRNSFRYLATLHINTGHSKNIPTNNYVSSDKRRYDFCNVNILFTLQQIPFINHLL